MRPFGLSFGKDAGEEQGHYECLFVGRILMYVLWKAFAVCPFALPNDYWPFSWSLLALRNQKTFKNLLISTIYSIKRLRTSESFSCLEIIIKFYVDNTQKDR